MFCRHKYGEVTAKGYQYCAKCGKGIMPRCAHKWEIIKELWTPGHKQGTREATFWIQKCKLCGKLQTYSFRG